MLVNLRNIQRAQSIAEATKALRQGAYPLYGGGATLIRADAPEVEEAVDLTKVVPAQCQLQGRDMFLGGGATLQQVSAYDPALGEFIAADLPNTLRNAFTVADWLLDCPAHSLFLGLLYGLVARVDTPGRGADDVFELSRWFDLDAASRRQHLILGVIIPDFPTTKWHFAYEKVSRTPADRALVGAVGFAYAGDFNPGSYSVIVGARHHPARYQVGDKAEIGDYKGSLEYRTEMMRVLSRRAIVKAEALANPPTS
jgi:CO/xanthine dehydrogenase FAD-binding subunit